MRALRWPHTLASRLGLIFLISLLIANGLTFGLQFHERYQSARQLMLGNLGHDLATTLAVLERLPADERQAWLARYQHPTYQVRLDDGAPGSLLKTTSAPAFMRTLHTVLSGDFSAASALGEPPAHVLLGDGTSLTIDLRPSVAPLSSWLPLVLIAQGLIVLGCTWLAVRIAIRPLAQLSKAVDTLEPDGEGTHLEETGPAEVAYAAVAFNALQARIATHVKDRMQLLAAISHDLQTPITRMKLRAELMDDSPEKDKLWRDLSEMQHLVQEGVAYARSMANSTEAIHTLDVHAFLESLVFDYLDTGKRVTLSASGERVIATRPHALRRLLVNLLDNALNYACQVHVEVREHGSGGLSICVLDRGPGIPEAHLAQVLEPFYRLERPCHRDVAGTGLGLAISQQLARCLQGTLALHNREGGGLCAQVTLPGDISPTALPGAL